MAFLGLWENDIKQTRTEGGHCDTETRKGGTIGGSRLCQRIGASGSPKVAPEAVVDDERLVMRPLLRLVSSPLRRLSPTSSADRCDSRSMITRLWMSRSLRPTDLAKVYG
jgi:hypothetical protein